MPENIILSFLKYKKYNIFKNRKIEICSTSVKKHYSLNFAKYIISKNNGTEEKNEKFKRKLFHSIRKVKYNYIIIRVYFNYDTFLRSRIT